MPEFTLSLKKVIEYTGGSITIVDGISRMSGGNIGLGYYPIFNETHRNVLTGKIIDHYWNQEIGVETIEMFQMAMRRRMNEIMPSYNKLYLSELIQFDPLSTVNLRTMAEAEAKQTTEGTNTESQLSESEGESSSESDTTGKSRAVNSEFPQHFLKPDGDYATSAQDANSESSVIGTGTETGKSETESSATTNSGLSLTRIAHLKHRGIRDQPPHC